MGGPATFPVERVWDWLSAVPDPEIPVISITELGIVRDVAWDNDTLVVAVTPTYSGCPATSVINIDIERALRERGVKNLRLERRLSPPWTTDWISREGREKLRAYGIAPPVDGSAADGRVVARIDSLLGRQSSDRLPPLRLDANGENQPVRLDAVQGRLPLPSLPRAFRLLQMHLILE